MSRRCVNASELAAVVGLNPSKKKYVSKLCIHASELAAVVGLNPYKKSEVALGDIWERSNEGRSAGCFAPGKVEDTICQNVLLKRIGEILTGVPTAPTMERCVKLAKVAVAEALEEERCVAHKILQGPDTAVRIVERIKTETRFDINEKSLKSVTDKQVDVVKFVMDLQVRPTTASDSDIVSAAVEEVQQTFGSRNESVTISRLEQLHDTKVTDNNAKLYYLSLSPDVLLCGRIDGFMGGKLIEVKNRRSRFFHQVPVYEKVQLHCYMKMVDVREATLVEHYNDDIRETTVTFEDAFWDNVCQKVFAFEKNYRIFISNPSMQTRYWTTGEVSFENVLQGFI